MERTIAYRWEKGNLRILGELPQWYVDYIAEKVKEIERGIWEKK